MKENLAAINVVCNGKLINRNSVPLLFYWNGETDLIEDIKNNIDFMQWLEDEEILTNINNYLNSHIALFYFKSHDEDYQDQTINIQELYNISTLSELKLELLVEQRHKQLEYRDHSLLPALYFFLFHFPPSYHLSLIK